MRISDFRFSNLNELSTEKLAQYKTAATAQSKAADSAGDFKKGNKRFKGITKATNKQFANTAKDALAESTSLESTLAAIVNDISEPVAMTYNTMKNMAQKYFDNHGEMGRGFNMVAAGVGGRWVQNFYINRLHNELYDLTKYSPNRTAELKEFLRGYQNGDTLELSRSFGNISKELPDILYNIGNGLKFPQLVKAARRWQENRDAYYKLLSELEMQADDDDEQQPAKPTKNALPGQQNAQVDQIISSVLSKLPKNVAGDIRNAIARSDNKLQALQQELNKRKISLEENAKSKSSKAEANYLDHAPSKSKCQDCTMFRAPSGCTVVEGKINPQGVCDYFEAKSVEENQRLDDKCWSGYKKSGTKLKGGTRVNNCVKIGEAYETQMSALINQILINETIQNNKR